MSFSGVASSFYVSVQRSSPGIGVSNYSVEQIWMMPPRSSFDGICSEARCPLPKANRGEHLKENLGAFDFEIGKKDIDLLNGLNQHYSSLGALPYV